METLDDLQKEVSKLIAEYNKENNVTIRTIEFDGSLYGFKNECDQYKIINLSQNLNK